jgi:hypothetical protein
MLPLPYLPSSGSPKFSSGLKISNAFCYLGPDSVFRKGTNMWENPPWLGSFPHVYEHLNGGFPLIQKTLAQQHHGRQEDQDPCHALLRRVSVLRSRHRPTRAQRVVDTGLNRLTAGSIELAKAKSVTAHCLFSSIGAFPHFMTVT